MLTVADSSELSFLGSCVGMDDLFGAFEGSLSVPECLGYLLHGHMTIGGIALEDIDYLVGIVHHFLDDGGPGWVSFAQFFLQYSLLLQLIPISGGGRPDQVHLVVRVLRPKFMGHDPTGR